MGHARALFASSAASSSLRVSAEVCATVRLRPAFFALYTAQSAPQDLFDGVALFDLSHSERRGDFQFLVSANLSVHDCQPQSFGSLDALLQCRARTNDDEFLASVARYEVAGIDFVPEAVRDVDEHLVAHGVSKRVVDRLEVIDIGKDRAEGIGRLPLLLVEHQRELNLELPAINQRSQ